MEANAKHWVSAKLRSAMEVDKNTRRVLDQITRWGEVVEQEYVGVERALTRIEPQLPRIRELMSEVRSAVRTPEHERRHEALVRELGGIERQIQALEAQLGECRGAAERGEQALPELARREDIEALKESVALLPSALEEIEHTLARHEESRRSEPDQGAALESLIAPLESGLGVLQGRIEFVAKNLRESETASALALLQREVATIAPALSEATSALDARLEAFEPHAGAVEAALAPIGEGIEAARAALEALPERFEAIEARAEEVPRTLDALSQALEALPDQIERLGRDDSQRAKALAAIEARLGELTESLASLRIQDRGAEITQALTHLSKAMAHVRPGIESMQEGLGVLCDRDPWPRTQEALAALEAPLGRLERRMQEQLEIGRILREVTSGNESGSRFARMEAALERLEPSARKTMERLDSLAEREDPAPLLAQTRRAIAEQGEPLARITAMLESQDAVLSAIRDAATGAERESRFARMEAALEELRPVARATSTQLEELAAQARAHAEGIGQVREIETGRADRFAALETLAPSMEHHLAHLDARIQALTTQQAALGDSLARLTEASNASTLEPRLDAIDDRLSELVGAITALSRGPGRDDQAALLAALSERVIGLEGQLQQSHTYAQIDRDLLRSDVLEVLGRITPLAQPTSFELETEHPVAQWSHDQRHALGSAHDNTRCARFVTACERIFARPVTALDLGCAGGGLVCDFAFRGHDAVGVDGSDAARKAARGGWRLLPDRFFCADITEPFTIRRAGRKRPARFDVISAWEVLEHIPKQRLPGLFANIARHLAPGGLFVASVATFECVDAESGEPYHVTLEDRAWWEKRIRDAGLEVVDDCFETVDFSRGSGNGPVWYDWNARTQPDMGFHLVARRAAPTSR